MKTFKEYVKEAEDHKYTKRTGGPGNYEYEYPEDGGSKSGSQKDDGKKKMSPEQHKETINSTTNRILGWNSDMNKHLGLQSNPFGEIKKFFNFKDKKDEQAANDMWGNCDEKGIEKLVSKLDHDALFHLNDYLGDIQDEVNDAEEEYQRRG